MERIRYHLMVFNTNKGWESVYELSYIQIEIFIKLELLEFGLFIR